MNHLEKVDFVLKSVAKHEEREAFRKLLKLGCLPGTEQGIDSLDESYYFGGVGFGGLQLVTNIFFV